MIIYKEVELKEGNPVQYVGVYLLRWRQEWGQPTIGFEQDEDFEASLYHFKEWMQKYIKEQGMDNAEKLPKFVWTLYEKILEREA